MDQHPWRRMYEQLGLGECEAHPSQPQRNQWPRFPMWLLLSVCEQFMPFAILIFQDVYSPQPVWSANQNRPVGFNATVRLTEEGDLILADADGTFVWSTNTAGKPTLAAPQLHPFPANYLNISLLELQNTRYFTFQVDIQSTDVEICKQTCLKN
ncbi:hypothetical protein AAG906_014379 [Vitis piasezkii]